MPSYQGFSLLTANPAALTDQRLVEIAARAKATPEQIVFRFARLAGMTPLTGTTDRQHMKEDLAAEKISLSAEDVARVEAIAS